MPAWLTTRVGRASLCIGLVAAAICGANSLAIVSSRTGQTLAAAAVLTACILALRELSRRCRRGGCPPALRRFWRLQRTVVCVIAAGAGVAGAAASAHEPTASQLRIAGLALSFASLAMMLWATVHIPGGGISTRHRVTATLDLVTLMIAGLLGFWILAIEPVMRGRESTGMEDDRFWSIALIAIYAFLSLLLMSTLLLMPFRTHEPNIARGLRFLAGAAIAVVAAEVVPYCIDLARDGWRTAPPLFGWTLALLGIWLHASLADEQRASASMEVPSQARVAMPYAAIGLLAVLALTALPSREIRTENASVFLFALFAAFILVVVRQTIIARENFGLALEMQHAKEVAESANNARLQFLANISHDLRTPLNGVLGCAQILLREKTMTSKQKELLKTIQGCGEHLRNLINDLLDLSKLEADKLELAPSPFDLKALLGALIKTFALEAETKKIILELEQAPELPDWIQCDRKRLQQILGNLVHNAIKFTDHGRVKVRARVVGGAMIFDVIDTGCGILPHKIDELFQPFHVVDERSIRLEGTGLGLSICKKLANKMGGDISVTSKHGKGSTFSVVVPLVLASPVVEVQRTVVDYQGRRRRVLIVDDNTANRVVLRTMLEPLDFLIHEADGAAAAHEQIQLAQPDIVLLDLMMPGTDGFTLCRQILELDILRMPVLIAVSALAGEEVMARCRQAGFADLLNKPVHLDALVESLRAYAGVEWTYGVIHPAPLAAAAEDLALNEPIIPPPAEEVSAFLDLARRGVVRNIETRAEQLAHAHPEYTPFARRVARYARDFKLKELGEWLASLSSPHVHGSA